MRAANAGDRVTGLAFATRSEVVATHAMAATSQPLATQIALDVMKAGGAAVKAFPVDGFICWGDPDALAESQYWRRVYIG